MSIAANLFKINKYIDTWQERMIADLRDVCAIKSIAGSAEYYGEMSKMVKWIEARLRQLKATTCERFDIGCYVADGKTLRLPTVVLASFGKDIKKKTVLVYGMYDVKNANAEAWESDPWLVQQKGPLIYGRGSCRGKAQLLSWFHAIEAYNANKIPLPVNLKFIIEGMSEKNCFGLEEFLYTKRITFMKGIDYVMINQSEWLNETIPCISYGACGLCQFNLIVGGGGGGGGGGEGGGDFDKQAITDYILGNFVDNLGNILIPHINNDVVQITPEIEQSFDMVNCDLSHVIKNLPPFMQTWSKQKILLRMWQMPQLVLGPPPEEVSCSCGGGGGAGGSGDAKEGGSGRAGGGGDDSKEESSGLSSYFVFKIVPVQTPDRCAEFTMAHIVNLMRLRFPTHEVTGQRTKSGKSMTCRIASGGKQVGFVRCTMTSETRAWQEDSTSPHYEAVKRASGRVFKYPPNMIKESTDSPIILILDKLIHKNTVLLPLNDNRMDAEFNNECIHKMTYFDGKKLIAAYMAEVAVI